MKEYQTKLQTYSADAQNQTEVTNQARQKELARNGTKHSTIPYKLLQQDIQKKQADLLKPLIDKGKSSNSKGC